MPNSVQQLISRLSFRQLQVFRAVYRHRNYSKAGEQLGLTQPAVSSQVRQLELALKQPVFEYVGRKLFCTAAGEQLASCIEVIFEELGTLQNQLVIMGNQVAGDLNIAAVDTAHCILPYLLKDFMPRHPQVQVHARMVTRSESLQRLADYTDHLVIMGMAPVDKTLATLPFLDNELIPLVAPGHPLLSQPDVRVQDFLYHGLIVGEQESGTHQALTCWSQQCRIPLQPVMQIDSNEGLKHAVMAGLGVTVLPKLTVLSELHDGSLQQLPLDGFPLRRSWCLVYLSDKQPNPAMRAFVDFIQDNIQTIEQQFARRAAMITTSRQPSNDA
ncbi:LysR family transcriptional regulator [Oceanobacter sp. 5_MG-2023]|uniref:LysR family transcriptional regulator n=1 Tax=Oceanobacter sp. 5_MG-2023 TaxID=3062645 RepID=UPI0026E41593|nr:LysR family transcriptional regulator [Oceanobacter sp. 5_MG-2023]MDO6682065.1 LysR family transcriptional regulator [Oceanobacter sp. 5_MG-2023]